MIRKVKIQGLCACFQDQPGWGGDDGSDKRVFSPQRFVRLKFSKPESVVAATKME